MEKLFTRKEAAGILGISLATLDVARNSGQITYVQYVENGCVFFTEAGIQEFIARSTHRAVPKKENMSVFIPNSSLWSAFIRLRSTIRSIW